MRTVVMSAAATVRLCKVSCKEEVTVIKHTLINPHEHSSLDLLKNTEVI